MAKLDVDVDVGVVVVETNSNGMVGELTSSSVRPESHTGLQDIEAAMVKAYSTNKFR